MNATTDKSRLPIWEHRTGLREAIAPPWMTMEEYRSAAMAGCFPEFKPHHDPATPPLAIGDIVSKLVRPSDLTQEWKVIGLCFYFFGCGWKATIVRVNRKMGVVGDEHYFASTASLHRVNLLKP